jgi:outer membrane lipoprotein-sorting protein
MRAIAGAAARRGLGLCLLLPLSCAHRIPLPERLRVNGPQELGQRMRRAQSPLTSYSAEARVTYFGREGRVRTTGSIAVRRPASLRYEVMGPHGGVVTAFASDGVELYELDLGASRFYYGPATAAGFDRLFPFAPLGLNAEQWVHLLFGELELPEQAALSYDDHQGRFVVRWREGSIERRVEVDPASARLTGAQVLENGQLLSDVQIDERDAQALPVAFRLAVPPEKTSVEVKLRDVEANPELDPSLFVLTPPAGVVPEHL